ncbi:hypothetical protein HMPREF2532_03671 [Bacteroides ovatus]|uniref:Uncharacterized protein n=1 Tax=Bacteroides ovatus (strain ATCC 8483 / DSM 1896 / JCM 5824 / BCRC 10623 / CCUG 4943 / NCTC 11153) TaxID=411476 RepID=A0AAN3A697_BACO1|nr:hypothetical protein BACOVA_04031 [Bacteroides ovatus ATCC 8483]EEO55637.1 hypothetical protein BSCG_02562 [Bacteroides sp. 2_2_4]KXT43820.1 hypothetical protein HMPREF2532_03671 [Bacteroides ovatus]
MAQIYYLFLKKTFCNGLFLFRYYHSYPEKSGRLIQNLTCLL